MKHWSWKWILRPVLILAIMLLIAKGIGYWLSPMERRAFDQNAWLQGDTELRASMAIGARNQIVEGMDEMSIVSILGKPMSIEAGYTISGWPKQKADKTYVYYLGTQVTQHDSTFLWIYVNAEGKVITAEIGGF